MSHLTDAQVALQLDDLLGWKQEGQYIIKTYEFNSFVEAISFMTEVAFHAEEIEHHPEWTNVFNKVHVRLTTHDVSGISSHDIRLAKRMEQVSSARQV